MLYFITGNKNKFEEIQRIVNHGLEQLNIDLTEIQELDVRKIIEHKLHEAAQHHQGSFIVEDTSLYLDCLNGLPGPFIKWFEKTIGNDGIVKLVTQLGNNKASAKVLIGYLSPQGINYFEGTLSGQIVAARGDKDFGWGPIFQPDGYEQTFGEMDRSIKDSLSMRKIAAEKLRDFINSQS